mmetsp:Transcript_31782/g.62941  ORF Transcript_31782/g.62941 Transcript_31782/m.62941 type:complete len:168 (-) Transcript_31782:1097-1600(-)
MLKFKPASEDQLDFFKEALRPYGFETVELSGDCFVVTFEDEETAERLKESQDSIAGMYQIVKEVEEAEEDADFQDASPGEKLSSSTAVEKEKENEPTGQSMSFNPPPRGRQTGTTTAVSSSPSSAGGLTPLPSTDPFQYFLKPEYMGALVLASCLLLLLGQIWAALF